MMEIKSILVDYWFSDKEADVYITCLELGSTPVSSIARIMKSNRVTVYSILKNLVNKWVITELTKKNTTYYSTIWPDKLLKKLQDKCENFEKSMPLFLSIVNKLDNKPKVKFFEWIEWVRQMYIELLDSWSDEVFSFLWTWIIDKKLVDYLNLQFLPKRIKIGMHAKVILNNNQLNINYYAALKKTGKKTLTEYKVYNYPFFNMSNEINIYWKDRIALVLFSNEEMSGIVIQSKHLHDSLKSVFDLIWSCCPENDKSIAIKRKP